MLRRENGGAGRFRVVSRRLTVVVPNWNGERFLRTCLGSLRRQSFEGFETVLVDNGSTDASVASVSQDFPEVRVLPLGENRGFSAAVNAGIMASQTDYVALLNNDTEADPDWLRALVQAADSYPEVGSFASKLVDFNDRRILDGAGDVLRRSGLPYRLGHGEPDRGQYDEATFVFGACAGAALYRRSMLDEIGLFDEDFFANCEDGDLSFRAQLAGYRCLYVPQSVVYHMGSATFGKRSPTATRLGTRNSLCLLVKNLPAPLVAGFLPFVVAGQLSRLIVTASTSTLTAHLEGLAGALRLLPLMLRKRREIQKHRRASIGYIKALLKESSRSAGVSLRRRLMYRVGFRL
jgi:GT2 family glycosyltransferase